MGVVKLMSPEAPKHQRDVTLREAHVLPFCRKRRCLANTVKPSESGVFGALVLRVT